MDRVFLSAAARYWTSVFPHACREIRVWQRRAQAIPDPMLRVLAANALRAERGNLEGAAVFATFVPRVHQATVLRAVISFQAAYDYVDAISEQQWQRNPYDDTASLHRCLAFAIDPGLPHSDYYAHTRYQEDGGYLRNLVEQCQASLVVLPAFPAAVAALRRTVLRIEAYQLFHHGHHLSAPHGLAYCTIDQSGAKCELNWWEIAAAAGSSLPIFALIVLMAHPGATGDVATDVERAYFPWIGSLHILLDCLVDRREDATTGQPSLIEHYESESEVLARIGTLATYASERASLLDEKHHNLIVAAMTAFYLSCEPGDPLMRQLNRRLSAAFGSHTRRALLILRVKAIALTVIRRLDFGYVLSIATCSAPVVRACGR